jgi:Big-like domain-containing protein
VRRLTVLLGLVLLVSSCSKGSSTSPGDGDDGFSINVTSPNANVFLGATEQMTATASDGHALSGSWGTDAPAVLSVSSTGVVTAVSAGLANIFFVAEGRQGTKSMRALPNFAGNYTGQYVVTSCSSTPALEDVLDICRTAPAGTLVPYTFAFNQVGPVLSGNVLILGIPVVPSFSTTIGAGGDATVVGTVAAPGGYPVNTTWTIVQKTAGAITGTITQTVTAPGVVAGQATISGSISTIVKTS